jgi:hypothetical protein
VSSEARLISPNDIIGLKYRRKRTLYATQNFPERLADGRLFDCGPARGRAGKARRREHRAGEFHCGMDA